MTILIDQNEPAAVDLYLQSYGHTTDRVLLNRPATPPRPDYGWYLPGGAYLGVSRKQAGEFIGAVDACESQLLDEMGGTDYMALLIEGRFGPAPGGCYVYDYGEIHGREREGVVYGSANGTRRLFRQNYRGVRQKLARFWDLGILVIETHDVEDTAMCLSALYNELQKPTAALTTFRRLIPDKYRLDEPDAAKKRFALQLMGAVPGVGEEIALALADCLEEERLPMTLWSLGQSAQEFDMTLALTGKSLRSGKRTVGPAAVKRIREALGC